ncbi:MAG: hypothetical protein JKY66_09635 [Spongiibacteraceae bacterium]|nr:hypothetical protein [Spongiibacteraceae bacterium]MBN4055609.1 hypothetical protein [bacterium AH-315-K03]
MCKLSVFIFYPTGVLGLLNKNNNTLFHTSEMLLHEIEKVNFARVGLDLESGG